MALASSSHRFFKLSLLASLIGSAMLPAMAATPTDNTATNRAAKEETLTVVAKPDDNFSRAGIS